MRISDWSSDVCSSDLLVLGVNSRIFYLGVRKFIYGVDTPENVDAWVEMEIILFLDGVVNIYPGLVAPPQRRVRKPRLARARSEEHTSDLQSLMRISYAVFCLKKKKTNKHYQNKQVTQNILRRRYHHQKY